MKGVKSIALAIVAALSLGMVARADAAKALLVVQNHTAVKDAVVLTAMGDLVASALDNAAFEIINPNDVVGETQNVGPWGENMPAASAARLAEACGADVLLTAAITECSRRNVGLPAKASSYAVTWVISAKRVPGGETVCAITAPYAGRKHSAKVFDAESSAILDVALRESVSAAAGRFLAKAATCTFAPATVEKIQVCFVANVPGADVKVDGMSVGTASTNLEAPMTALVAKGVHNLEISYPYMEPYKTVARFEVPSTFAVNLHESAEGRRMRMEDTQFETTIKRVLDGGATDDEVKLVRAKGYADCLRASSIKIEGMPAQMTLVNGDLDKFGFGIIQDATKPDTDATDKTDK